MILGIDLDGVCYDFVTALASWAVESGEVESLDDVPAAESWDFFKNQWGWDSEQYLRVFGDGVCSGKIFWTGTPIPGCVETLKRLQEQGHRIVIVTHRSHPDKQVSRLMKQATLAWLADNDVPYDSLMFEGIKTGLPVDLLLDDAPHNIKAAVEAGEPVAVFDQAWNRWPAVNAVQPGGAYRVVGWDDFAGLVEHLSLTREMQTSEIIGLAGYAQAGKDTVARVALPDYTRVSFADALREVAYAIDPLVPLGTDLNAYGRLRRIVDEKGWDRAKVEHREIRELLQRIGTEAGRKILGEDVWVNVAMAKVKPGGAYVFTDVRFPNEAKAIKAAGGQVWRIKREGTGPVNAHPSETALDDWPFDRIIANNGTVEDLRALITDSVDSVAR